MKKLWVSASLASAAFSVICAHPASAQNTSLTASNDQGKITLEMIFHPEKRVNFMTKPLTRMLWDNQNRLVESKPTKEGLELYAVNPRDWTKTLIPVDGNLLGILKNAKIDDKEIQTINQHLSAQIRPEVKSYIFKYKKDIWLLDLAKNVARPLTKTPDVDEDEALISPDFKQVAYLKGNDLYITNVETTKETRLTTGGSETLFNGRLDWVYQEEIYGRGDYRAFRWAPDSKRLAFLSLDDSKVPVYTLSGDHKQPIETERARYPKAGDPNPIAKLGVVDLNGKITWTDNPYPKQETLIVQFDFTPEGKLMAGWQDRVQTWLDLRIYDDKFQSKIAVRETSPAWQERLPLPHFLKDGSFIWQSDRTGYRHLYLYDKTFQFKGAITQGEWEVRSVFGVDEKEGLVLFSATERNAIGNDAYSIDINGKNMKRLTEEKGTHHIRWNQTFTHFIDSWSSLTQTPKQALFARDGTLIKLIDDVGMPENLKGKDLATMKQVQVKSARTGSVMEALLFLPPRFDESKKYPIYHYQYSGPRTPQVRDIYNNNAYYHFLAQQGYVVWVLDPQGSSNKSAVSAWPIHKKLGEHELSDQIEGLDWLATHPWADMSRVALSGWSYGGYITSYAMTHSNKWKIGLVGAPVTDYRLYDSIYTERYMGLPQTNAEGYDKGSVLKAAQNLSGKILIMHGSMDDNVHPQNAIMLIDALAKADKEYEFQIYPGQQHVVTEPWLKWSLEKAKFKFIKDNL